MAERIEEVDAIIRSEVNVKEIRLIRDAADSEVSIVKKVKPDFKAMGPRFGKRMKAIAAAVSALDADSIADLEKQGSIEVNPQDGEGAARVDLADVEVLTEDIPGWLVSSANGVTVALDITLDDGLRAEGLARELVNRVQNVRKDGGLEVTDRIELVVAAEPEIESILKENLTYIAQETLADEVLWKELQGGEQIQLSEGAFVALAVTKKN